MNSQNFTTTIWVDQTPAQAFEAITNPRAWWSEEIVGGTRALHDTFTYHYKDVHRCNMTLTEVIPNQRVVWLVTFNDFNFIEDKSEWIGTKVIFDITPGEGHTQIRFTHQGLVPAYECYNVCQNAWTMYIQQSLRDLIVTGKGKPNPKEN